MFGIADFLDAVLLGTVYNTALMQRLPLVLIPCFFVPLLFMGAHHTAGTTEEIVSPSAVAGHSVQVLRRPAIRKLSNYFRIADKPGITKVKRAPCVMSR
jgi:hypothetical protein